MESWARVHLEGLDMVKLYCWAAGGCNHIMLFVRNVFLHQVKAHLNCLLLYFTSHASHYHDLPYKRMTMTDQPLS